MYGNSDSLRTEKAHVNAVKGGFHHGVNIRGVICELKCATWLVHMCDRMHSSVTNRFHIKVQSKADVAHMNESRHTCQRIVSHFCMSQVTHVTCAWVKSLTFLWVTQFIHVCAMASPSTFVPCVCVCACRSVCAGHGNTHSSTDVCVIHEGSIMSRMIRICNVSYDAFMCVTYLIHQCDMAYLWVKYHFFMCMYLCVWHDSFTESQAAQNDIHVGWGRIMYMLTFMCVCVLVCVCVCVCEYTCACVCACVKLCVCHVCVVHVCTWMHTCACDHAHVQTN